MFKHLTFYCLTLLSLLLSATVTFAQMRPQSFSVAANPAEVGFSADRLARLDTMLQGYINRGAMPSVVTFVARKGKIVHNKAYGQSRPNSKTPARTDDIYRIMSQTKLITTIGLLMLMEEGKFYLDEPISHFLPQFENPRVLVNHDPKDPARYMTKPASRPITFRHLLSHTAGIPYEHPLDALPEYKLPFLVSLDNLSLETMVDKIAQRPLVSEPGEKYVYGLNTDVAGRLIEVMSGKNLEQYLRERVCEPLGMTDAWFYLPQNSVSRLVDVYAQDKRGQRSQRHTSDLFQQYPYAGARKLLMGGSGMSSTISDYAKLCQFVLNKGEFNGKRLLAPATVEMLANNQIGENFVWDRQDKFSLGLQIFSPDSHYGDNATPGALMWGGYFCTEYTIDPKRELVLLVFTNMQPFAEGGDVQRKFRIMVYSALME
jgi:CubicO group peptidase (beta-lactamase class C family)